MFTIDLGRGDRLSFGRKTDPCDRGGAVPWCSFDPLLFLLGVAALAAGACVADAARVTALSEMILHRDYARTDKPPFVGGGQALAVRGRPGAARVQAYALAVTRLEASRKDDLAQVAHLGRLRDGRPIVATDKGPFAIEMRGLVVGRNDAVVVIDVRDARIVRSYLGGLVCGMYVVRGPDRIAVLAKSDARISAPSSRPDALEAASGCEERRETQARLEFSEHFVGAIDATPNADLALVRKLMLQTRGLDDAQLRARIGRLEERHLLSRRGEGAGFPLKVAPK